MKHRITDRRINAHSFVTRTGATMFAAPCGFSLILPSQGKVTGRSFDFSLDRKGRREWADIFRRTADILESDNVPVFKESAQSCWDGAEVAGIVNVLTRVAALRARLAKRKSDRTTAVALEQLDALVNDIRSNPEHADQVKYALAEIGESARQSKC